MKSLAVSLSAGLQHQSMEADEMGMLKSLERVLLVGGLALTIFYAGGSIHKAVCSRAAVQRFEAQRSAGVLTKGEYPGLEIKADLTLWSGTRIKEYQASLAEQFSPALAIIRVPRIDLEVPVFEGTTELTLNRGVGRIPGTGQLRENGNIGIAGHRDGFFRGLKDITEGDTIEMAMTDGTATYVVDHLAIVSPDDISVLQKRQHPSLTLVTCYPFYFIGHAPKRYIVQASLASALTTRNTAAKQEASQQYK